MARSEARLHFDIWRGLEALSPDARLLYVVLLADRSVNHAGVGSIRLDQWQRHSALPIERVEKAVVELGAEPHIAFDRYTGEFLIRTMIRNDGYADQPYLLKGALAVARNTESATLRRILALELRKLPPRRPDGETKSGKPIVYPDPHACADAIDPGEGVWSEPQRSSPEGVETLSGGSTEGLKTLSERCPKPDISKGSPEGFETLGGGGGGGGSFSSPSVDGEAPSELVLVPSAAVASRPLAAPAVALSVTKRAQALASTYYDKAPLCNYTAVMKIVMQAIKTDRYADEQIETALLRIAADGWSVTANTLRTALEGPPRRGTGRPTTDDHVAGALSYLRPEHDENHGTAR